MTRQILLLLLWLLAATAVVTAEDAAPASQPTAGTVLESTVEAAETLDATVSAASGQDATSLIKWVGIVTVISLAPALAVLVTSFTRIVVVLGLLRQGLSMPQLPPNQILFGLALLMTVVVMAPTIQTLNDRAISPLMDNDISQEQALAEGNTAIRAFMIRQMESADTADAVYAFLDPQTAARDDLVWADVSTWALIPGFVLGELKVAFLMGLRILLPFVIIDMLVGSVLVSMGMLMLPPVLVAVPLKLLMFVLADGWSLIAGTLMNSFAW